MVEAVGGTLQVRIEVQWLLWLLPCLKFGFLTCEVVFTGCAACSRCATCYRCFGYSGCFAVLGVPVVLLVLGVPGVQVVPLVSGAVVFKLKTLGKKRRCLPFTNSQPARADGACVKRSAEL